MSWSTPRTWATGETVTAANMNTYISDNLTYLYNLNHGVWTTWSPTLTQNGTRATTNSYSRYRKIGRVVTAQCRLLLAATGTALNRIYLSTPVNRAYTTAEQVIGTFRYTDASSGAVYRGCAFGDAANERMSFQHMPSGNFIGDGESFAVDTNDVLTVHIQYESAAD